MAISQEFAPPFKLIAPYFIVGVVVYVVSVALLFGFDITQISTTSANVLGWVHLLLLGCVMMIIFGAMAQLVPVVLEVGHFAVELYYIITPLLFVGSIMMAYGFVMAPALLPYGGVVVLIALLVFVFETFMTILKVKKMSVVITSVALANGFLFFGLVFGIIMALGYAGQISVNLSLLIYGHIYLVFVGYVGITIMGMSMILLPMFWLSHSFSWRSVTIALWLISLGVVSVALGAVFGSTALMDIGYALSVAALGFYFYQISIIYKTRVRIENDIYFRSMVMGYGSFVSALIVGVVYLFSPNSTLLVLIGWLSIFGFVIFLIVGHLYKIVPFLVWYQKFSPLVGKQSVPMLADMLPKRSSSLQFVYSSVGVAVGAVAILVQSQQLFNAAVSFLLLGAVFVLKDIIYMMRYE